MRGTNMARLARIGCTVRTGRRNMFTPPFQNDLGEVDSDDFNLADFQYVDLSQLQSQAQTENASNSRRKSLYEVADTRKPLVVVSHLHDPYINLAVEDFLFTRMPLPTHSQNYNRLMFYTNSPCVVIGKNQNPWKEANLPLLNSLRIPLVRRRSGGGTVVHDMGNVNFSYMTTKEQFDRFTFAKAVADAVNKRTKAPMKLEVNERGDIVTEAIGGTHYKVSGSAYKLAKGRSYHHGTMLLSLRLDIIGQLLSRNEAELGRVDAMASVASVRAKVKNIEIASKDLQAAVTAEFRVLCGDSEVFAIDNLTDLPPEVENVAAELASREWKYGNTPKFTHEIRSEQYKFTVKFLIDRKSVVTDVTLTIDESVDAAARQHITESFEYLVQIAGQKTLLYSGSDVAGFVTDDGISDWLGNAIDGTS